MKMNMKRLFSWMLVLAMLFGMVPPVSANGGSEGLSFTVLENDMAIDRLTDPVAIEDLEQEPEYEATEIVRVSIVLEKASTVEKGFSTLGIADNAQANAYRQILKNDQAAVTRRIETAIAGELDVAWNLTLAANIISANVEYGQIEAISQVPGVKRVELEPRFEPMVVKDAEYEPQMIASTPMTGSDLAWAAGYTGAGSRVAIIDTGVDSDHQSLDAGAFLFSLGHQARLKAVDEAEYIAGLNLLDAEEVEGVKDKLNVEIDPSLTYLNEKIPYAYNYIDGDYDVTHDNDTQGSHGSHVTGIAAANAYLPADGGYTNALNAVHVQGVAPDAQVLTMKVFGKGGGAYATDYIAAIEDALILGCDSVNLSLGSAAPGYSTSTFEDVMSALVESDTVVCMSAGNSGQWNDNSNTGVPYLYADDVNMHTGGSPGTYTNSLAVASADNTGKHGDYIQVGGDMIFYSQTAYANAPIKTIAGEHEYVIIDGYGTAEDWAAVADELQGRVAVCSRGVTSFFEKANAAVEAGAIAVIIYNNQAGTINMNLEGYLYSAPVISVTQADGDVMKNHARGGIGTLTVAAEVGYIPGQSDYVTMSSFSSMGVPGSLILKPEITAPGGNIYSLNGVDKSGTAYENNSGTSMAAPQVTGMAALVAQYIRENGLEEKTGMSTRFLTNSLLMSTAIPEIEEDSGYYWSVLKQGSGLANVNNAVTAGSYIQMNEDATASWADGKVKAELLDDPQRTGEYSFGFSVNNFSDVDKSYTLNADIFTQDTFAYGDYKYLDTWTTPIAADVTYTIDGVSYIPTGTLACDLDADGDTDADDAQIILEYCAGNLADIDAIAELSGDGEITTYDAHLILNNLQTQSFTVAPGSKAEVQVTITFSDELKAWLDETYVNGAYVEGYVFVQSVETADGDLGVTHSIPVMGFYGGWTEANMFDRATYWDYQYGETIPNYTGNYQGHMFMVGRKGSGYAYVKQVNPYMIEDGEMPIERLAISRTDTITMYQWNMIRSASAVALVDLAEDGTVRNFLTYGQQFPGAFYYPNGGAWQSTASTWVIFQKLGGLDIQEGDLMNLSMVAIPEYYLPVAEPTPEDITKVIDSGVLGEGAYKSFPFTVDDTAPEIVSVSKSLVTGDLVVTAKDTNYIAVMQVLSADGQTVYDTKLPEATEAGQVTETVMEVGGKGVGSKCVIAVGDYAGNETFIEVEYGGEDPSPAGEIYLFTPDSNLGDPGWYKADPDSLYYSSATDFGGMANVAGMQCNVLAAEYVGGYVFVAADDGKFYVTKHGQWDGYTEVATWQGVASNIYDMAYNPTDGLIYATQSQGRGQGVLFVLNPYTGEFGQYATIKTVNPRGGPPMYKDLKALTIGPDGTFYAVNWGSGYNVFLYRFTKEDIESGATVNPVNSGAPLNIGAFSRPVMAYSETDGVLYVAGGSGAGLDNKLLAVNPADGTSTTVNSGAGITYVTTTGMYIIPQTEQQIQTTDTATTIGLSAQSVEIFVNSSYTLTADIGPWNLADPSVTWTTSDASVATVSGGVVTGVGTGTATITATSNATSDVTATCEITVVSVPEITFSAQVTDTDGVSYWADFTTADPAGFTRVADGQFAMGGALMGDQIYVQNGQTRFWTVDADSFAETTVFEPLHQNWSWSDATANPVSEDGYFGDLASVCYNGCYFSIVNPETGNVVYYNLFDTFLTDAMATLAFKETGTYVDANGNECVANLFYVITDGGELWELALYTPDDGGSFTTAQTHIGSTGIDLFNVSQMVGAYGTMIYDAETGYLVVSSSTEKNTTKMYVVDPETAATAQIGELDASVDSVTSMYQYARATELEVRISDTEASVYEGDSYQLTAKVRPAQYTGGVTWSSSDESVATVDENGLITGVSEGTATITVTSDDVNDEGSHATNQCLVTVQGLVPVDATVTAQIETDEGVFWAEIDLNTLETTAISGQTRKFTGAGYNGGLIAGTAGDFDNGGLSYLVDPSNDYAETPGLYQKQPNSMFLDLTNSPLAPGKYGSTEYEGFGEFISVSRSSLYVNASIIKGNATGWTLGTTYPKASAIAFYDWTYLDSSSYHVPYYRFLTLDTKGTLYTWDIYAMPYSGPWADSFKAEYKPTQGILGNIGIRFSDDTDLSMTVVRDNETGLNGLIIADSGKGMTSLYFVDMSGESLSVSKIGDMTQVKDLCGLYSDFNTINNVEDVPHAETGMTFGTNDTADSTSGTANMSCASLEPVSEILVGGYVKTGEVTGSTNAVTAETVITRPETEDTTVEVSEGTVTVNLSETENVTNGIIEVSYDPSVLTFAGITSPIANTAVNVDEDNGILVFDYAAATAVNALASLEFSFNGCVDTQITVTTTQRNTANTVTGEAVTLDVVSDEHSYELAQRVEPTCFADGYETLVCAVCGHSVTNVLPAGSCDCPADAYQDLDTNRWYHEGVDYVLSNGIMNGLTATHFGPDATLTRGQMVTILYRMAGQPETTAANPFTDVAEGRFYTEAVVWAVEAGITKGATTTEFAPETSVTREQLVTFLARYAAWEGKEVTGEADLSGYPDAAAVSPFAADAVSWAVANGLIQGMDGTLNPQGTATRAQIAAIILRYMSNI